MGLYQRYVLPQVLDCVCRQAPFDAERARIVAQATGDVLEVGIGTGLNLRHYDAGRVDHITGLDPAAAMHPKARQRLARYALPVTLQQQSAGNIPAPDGRFDTVLVTYTLCSIADPVAALTEMRRVLKPGGQLLFCEHGLAPDTQIARWQKRLTPVWRHIAGDCTLDHDVPASLHAAGFTTKRMDRGYTTGPKVLTYHYCGNAE